MRKKDAVTEITPPKGEKLWVSYYDDNHTLQYILTSKETRDYYYLYEVAEDGLKRLGRDRDPKVLEARFMT